MRKFKVTCSCCGYTENVTLTNAKADKLPNYREFGMIQEFLPEVPAWIRSGLTTGFCICPVCYGAEWVRTKRDLNIPGWGFIPEGTVFPLKRVNKRFVYAEVKPRVILKLARKGDCDIG